MPDFGVYRRDQHHWDVSAVGVGRAFAIRGEPGDVIVRDEREDASRPHPRPVLRFKSVAIAMAWIADELMQERATKTAIDEKYEEAMAEIAGEGWPLPMKMLRERIGR